jgi:hypothetical protein
MTLPWCRSSLRAGLAVAASLLLWGCGGGEGSDGEPSEQAADGAKLWFTAGEQFHTVERDSAKALTDPKPAVEALLAGPTEEERAGDVAAETQIPDGVSLEQLDLEGDGTAVVKLSPEFTRGIPAEPQRRNRDQQAELDARVAQVTYTLTQFEQVKDARVVSGGSVVDPDVDRQDYSAPQQGPKPIVKPRGAKVPGTRRVQTRLAKLGYLPKRAIDGLAGYQTQQAVIAFQSWSGLDRDGVVGPATSSALSTARRPKPRRGGPARRIEVYRDRGVTLLVDGGKTVRAIHVSAGAPGTITPSGRYSVFRKELQSWSVPFQTWLPYASYFNQGIAFHEFADVPTYPASHGCVRVPVPEAKGVYEFATVGTVVVVF